MKRLVSAMFMAMLMLVANLAEFVDEAERGVLRQAAATFSKNIRFFRIAELAVLGVLLVVGFGCDCVLDDDHGKSLAPERFVMVLWGRHKVITGAFLLAIVFYYVLLWKGFHCLALRCSRYQDRTVSPEVRWWRWLRLPNPRCYFLEVQNIDGQPAQQRLLSLEDGADLDMSTISSVSESGNQTRPEATSSTRRVPIAQASDVDLPESMRVDVNQRVHSHSPLETYVREGRPTWQV